MVAPMPTVALPSIRRRLVWLAVVFAALWLLTGCVDRHHDDNPFITPYGNTDTQPYG